VLRFAVHRGHSDSLVSHGKVVADGPPAAVAGQFGRANLEEVFLHLASEEKI
jgi:hypothetical protein